MKKWMLILFALIVAMKLTGCSDNETGANIQVFETEKITRITFCSLFSEGEEIEVPSEDMAEITAWLGTFTIGPKADEHVLIPGSNSVSVEIVYADGSVVKNGLSTIKVDGVTYYLNSENAPDCYLRIINQTE